MCFEGGCRRNLRREAGPTRPPVLLLAASRVVGLMSQTSQISSHMLTPRWTHAIDMRAESRREDSIPSVPVASSVRAALRDQAVPRAPVPLADVRRRTPTRQKPQAPIKGPTPLSVPQEIESIPDQQSENQLSAATSRTED